MPWSSLFLFVRGISASKGPWSRCSWNPTPPLSSPSLLPLANLLPNQKENSSNEKINIWNRIFFPSLFLSLSLQVFILPGALSPWFSCCFWRATGWVSKVKCLPICRVPSVQNLPGPWDPGSSHLCLQLTREKRSGEKGQSLWHRAEDWEVA